MKKKKLNIKIEEIKVEQGSDSIARMVGPCGGGGGGGYDASCPPGVARGADGSFEGGSYGGASGHDSRSALAHILAVLNLDFDHGILGFVDSYQRTCGGCHTPKSPSYVGPCPCPCV